MQQEDKQVVNSKEHLHAVQGILTASLMGALFWYVVFHII